MTAVNKIDVPPEHWDKLFAPSACLVTITTVDNDGRINAASYGTCVRVCHDPVYISFTTAQGKDTYNNVLASGEFVVNVPSHEREILEKVRVCGLEFPPEVVLAANLLTAVKLLHLLEKVIGDVVFHQDGAGRRAIGSVLRELREFQLGNGRAPLADRLLQCGAEG